MPTLNLLKKSKKLLHKSKKTLSDLAASCLDFAYPPHCFNCDSFTIQAKPLCQSCLEQLELIDDRERCRHCFASDPGGKYCRNCMKEELLFEAVAASFDYQSPAGSLIRKLKYSNKFWLAEGLGGYMAAQFIQLEWPMPQLIVPVPIPWTRNLSRGYNQSLLLAKEVGTILNCPVSNCLRRLPGDFSQAGLTKEQRMSLNGKNISLKNPEEVYDKTILLVDDVMTTGSTLKRCAEALMEGCPTKIFGLTFCHAE